MHYIIRLLAFNSFCFSTCDDRFRISRKLQQYAKENQIIKYIIYMVGPEILILINAPGIIANLPCFFCAQVKYVYEIACNKFSRVSVCT